MLLIRLSPLFKSLYREKLSAQFSYRIRTEQAHDAKYEYSHRYKKEELPLELLLFFKAMDTFKTIWLIN